MPHNPHPPASAIAFEHMTGLHRGAVTWLSGPELNVILDADRVIHITADETGESDPRQVACLRRVDDTYELRAEPGQNVRLNGTLASVQILRHGDTVEFGDTGPFCRLRVYEGRAPVHTVADILSDIAAYLRVSRQRPVRRAWRAGRALFGRLAHETSLLFRITVLLALFGFAFLAYQQNRLNQFVRTELDKTAAQLDQVANAVVSAKKEALHPSDLEDLRQNLERRVTSNVSRLTELEERTTAVARVIAASNEHIVFLQGTYGFREVGGSRMLRQAVGENGVPLINFQGRPLLTLEGDGPVVELQFAGSAFFVGAGGALITNRHVAMPWEQNAAGGTVGNEKVEPVMIRFAGFLFGQPDPVPVSLTLASDTTDLAVLFMDGQQNRSAGLELAESDPQSGEEVIVMGYPTGLRSMLAQAGAEFIQRLQESGETDFWSVAARLAREGFIAPLSSRGIVGQVTAATIVYDADTTSGGSGGPVLDLKGRVVAVNSAILPEYGGSNLGVPARAVRELLETSRAN